MTKITNDVQNIGAAAALCLKKFGDIIESEGAHIEIREQPPELPVVKPAPANVKFVPPTPEEVLFELYKMENYSVNLPAYQFADEFLKLCSEVGWKYKDGKPVRDWRDVLNKCLTDPEIIIARCKEKVVEVNKDEPKYYRYAIQFNKHLVEGDLKTFRRKVRAYAFYRDGLELNPPPVHIARAILMAVDAGRFAGTKLEHVLHDYRDMLTDEEIENRSEYLVDILGKDSTAFKYCLTFTRTVDMMNTFNYRGEIFKIIEAGELLFNEVPPRSSHSDIRADLLDEDFEDGFILAMYQGIKSYLASHPMKKTNREMLVARALGFKSHKQVPAELKCGRIWERYTGTNKRPFNNLIDRLSGFGVMKYGKNMRGFVITICYGSKVTADDLVKYAKDKKLKAIKNKEDFSAAERRLGLVK